MGLLYALPGMPIFFQGDECGFTGEAGQYPVNELYRYPIQWDRCNPDVLEFYQRLGKVRAGLAALQGPAFRAYAGEGAVLAFLRGEPGQEVVLAAFNKGSEPANLALPGGTWRDALSGQTFQSQAELPAIGFRYLVRAGQ
jgi:glycosidase